MCWFLRRGENRSTRRKTSRSKDENQQQTQPTYDTGTRSRTRATLVGGERSHHCAIPALQSIYKHYHYSPKALRELKELAEAMEEKILKPGNLKGTRWVPHLHRALKVFLKDYKVIYGHFNNTVGAATSSIEMQGRAKKILKQQEKFITVLFADFMVDVLDCLSKLVLYFRKMPSP